MKSNVSDHLEFIHNVYIDACMKCTADVSDFRDLETIRSRVKSEGLSFLTITLPNFCRDFERSLAEGHIDSTAFRSFRKAGSIPAFLQGMISQLFDHETGRIYDDKTEIASGDASTIVESIRQVCLSFKKLEVSCAPKRTQASLNSFIAIERSFDLFTMPMADRDRFCRVSAMLWSNMVRPIGLQLCHPKHGPGATAEHASGNRKYVWRAWHDRLEPYFPLIDSGYPIGCPASSEELEMVSIVTPEQEQPVRVVPVPKTLKGPRIIAIEPCCMQFVQQGIRAALYSAVESYWLTRGHVNFRDQSINQSLAIKSSNDGRLATIDLSDASDRVPRDLAMEMFRSNHDLHDAIDACRSTRAEMPDGSIIGPLRKFASMGSALCFPVEAMYFYTVCIVALLEIQNLPETPSNIFSVSRDVYVYGDDIIVPSTYADAVLEYLRKYNCKVNTNKTFVSGSFRESCGIDAYKGYEVTPTYLRSLRPKNRQQADQLISWMATSNSFYKKGYWRTAQFMFNQLERVLGPLPYVSEVNAALGRISFLGYRSVERWNVNLQRFEVKGWIPSPVYRTDKLEGYGALMKSFLKLEDLKNPLVSRDARHLEHSALHGAVALKRRWVPSLI
jgi:hypothetical protein